MPFLHFGWTSLVAFAIICWLLYRAVGWLSMLSGAASTVLFILLQIYFGREFGRRRRLTAGITDQRVRLSSEVLGGILSIKAYAWEPAFLATLSQLRSAEHASIYISQGMKAFNLALCACSMTQPAMQGLVVVMWVAVWAREGRDSPQVFGMAWEWPVQSMSTGSSPVLPGLPHTHFLMPILRLGGAGLSNLWAQILRRRQFPRWRPSVCS